MVYIFFDLVQILRCLAVILFFNPVDWLGRSLGYRKDIFDGVADNKVLAGFQTLDWLLVNARHGFFFMLAIVREVAYWRQVAISHGA